MFFHTSCVFHLTWQPKCVSVTKKISDMNPESVFSSIRYSVLRYNIKTGRKKKKVHPSLLILFSHVMEKSFPSDTNSNNDFSLIPADLFQLTPMKYFKKVMFVSVQLHYFTYVTRGLFNPLKMSV